MTNKDVAWFWVTVLLAVGLLWVLAIAAESLKHLQKSQREVARLQREVRTYRDAVGTLNLLLTEAQQQRAAGPPIVDGSSGALTISMASGDSGEFDSLSNDVLWLTRPPGSVERSVDPRTPVFSRDSQFIGTGREK